MSKINKNFNGGKTLVVFVTSFHFCCENSWNMHGCVKSPQNGLANVFQKCSRPPLMWILGDKQEHSFKVMINSEICSEEIIWIKENVYRIYICTNNSILDHKSLQV